MERCRDLRAYLLAVLSVVLTPPLLSAQADFVRNTEVILRFPLSKLTEVRDRSQRVEPDAATQDCASGDEERVVRQGE